MNIPTLSVDLIKVLDGLYPHRCPRPGDDPARMWMQAGKRELIDALLQTLEAQENEHQILGR